MENKSIKILVVEDEYFVWRQLKKTLESAGYSVVNEMTNIESSLLILKQENIDLVCLDINLEENEKNGIWLAQKIQELYNIPYLFISAYQANEILDKAIATKPAAYLTKPFNKVELIAAITLCLKQKEKMIEEKNILLRENGMDYKISIEKIDYIESSGNYLKIHTSDKVYTHRDTIKHFLSLLPSTNFMQSHRAFIVNIHKISGFNNHLVTINNIQIPVSINYKEKLMLLLNE